MKKLISLILAALLLAAALPFAALAEEPVHVVRYAAPGDSFAMQDEVLAKVNEKLKADGLNIAIELERIGWDAWSQKTQLMIASGESFGLLHVMQDLKSVGTLYGQGAIMDLTDYLDKEEFAPLKGLFSDKVWQECSVNGRIVAVPALSTASEGIVYGDVYYRKDVADRLGLKTPTNVDELIDFALALQKEISEEAGKPVYVWGGTLYEGRQAEWYLESLDEYSYVDTALGLIQVKNDGSVHSWIETQEFKDSVDIMNRMNEAGLVHPDILTLDHSYGTNEIAYGRYVLACGIGEPAGYAKRMAQNCPGAEIGCFRLDDSKEEFITFFTWNCNAVPATAEDPEDSLRFLQWLYTDKENYDLFMYGIEGETYTASGDNGFESIMAPDGNPLYKYDEWQIGFLDLRRFDPYLTEDIIAKYTRRRDLNEDAIVSPAVGFQFDTSAVVNEASNLAAEVPSVIYPMLKGLVSYEDGYANALETLKAAGLDAYLAEYEKQFTEWLANK